MEKVVGPIYTPEQLDNKWKGLKKIYKKIKDQNNSSGHNAVKWSYFNAMDNFLGKRPEVTPPATCSSSSGLIITEGKTTYIIIS